MKQTRSIHGLLLDVTAASRLLGMSERSLRAWIAKGKVPFRKLGRRVVFRAADLEKWIETLPGLSCAEAKANAKRA